MEEKNNNKAACQKKEDETVPISKKELEALRAKAAEADSFYDKYLRTHAEFENAKKRMEKEKIDFLRFSNERFIADFLPILDNLEAAEHHIKDAKDLKAVQEGVDMIQGQIQKYLADLGVEKIKTIGEKFDPHIHEAVETTDSNDKDDGIIVEEMKPGYRFNGRLLRPASVKIVKKSGKKNTSGD